MFDKTRVGHGVLGDFSGSKAYAPWSRVVLQVDDELSYTAGDDTGRTLTAANPFGTQQMAEDMLRRLKGSSYQPYSGTDALLDPAAELGDAVEIRGYYGGIYGRTRKPGKLYSADISAPSDEEIDHEYPYKSSQERTVTRQNRETKANLRVLADRILAEVEAREADGRAIRAALEVQAGEISAKVSQQGGNSASFGWSLTPEAMVWSAGGGEIVRFDADGASIRGKIEVLTGKIGGFDIREDCLSYNGQGWGGTNTWGAYLGTDGLQLGQNFRVDMAGNLEAASGRFTGEVYAGRISYGGAAGTFDGDGITQGSVSGGYGGQIGGGSVSTYNTTGGVNTSLGYANFANDVFNWRQTAPYVCCQYIVIDSRRYSPGIIRYKNQNGTTTTTRVLLTQD